MSDVWHANCLCSPAIPNTITDLDLIEHLDFEPGCEKPYGECDRPAEWAAYVSHDCRPLLTFCGPCKDRVVDFFATIPERWKPYCPTCQVDIDPRAFIDRIEPLR